MRSWTHSRVFSTRIEVPGTRRKSRSPARRKPFVSYKQLILILCPPNFIFHELNTFSSTKVGRSSRFPMSGSVGGPGGYRPWRWCRNNKASNSTALMTKAQSRAAEAMLALTREFAMIVSKPMAIGETDAVPALKAG
jgi:hypothetical protein